MTVKSYPKYATEALMLVCIAMAIMVTCGCSNWSEPAHSDVESEAPARASSSACIDIKGEVLGDIVPNSSIYLYEISGTKLTLVLGEIRTSKPIKTGTVNHTAGFRFGCVSPGKYAATIPTTSYNGSVGAPLPYEFDCDNFSLRIAFQGGDYHHAVGAFVLEDSPAALRLMCAENPSFCKDSRGKLYRNCSHVLR
ncbi:MAG: hypothetical protein SWQ30_19270 [Thermodesulfobacteriota bacterium]|nr:hypothetical protein [Thermodesulfobacteriota bacterium]